MAVDQKLKFTAEEMEKLFEDYKKKRSKEFDYRPELIKSGEKAGTVIQVPLPRPLSLDSFILFLRISPQTFANYSDSNYMLDEGRNSSDKIEDRRKLLEVCTRIRTEIRDRQLSGASNGIFNERIATRINGLNETVNIKQETKETVTIVNGIEKNDLTL